LLDWIANAVNLAGGFALSYAIAKSVLPRMVERSRHSERMVRLAFAGSVVALLPALLLSLLLGATLGAAWGAAGIAAGIAVVFALVLLAGTFAGVLLARLFRRPEA
jgi:hypothetical protein